MDISGKVIEKKKGRYRFMVLTISQNAMIPTIERLDTEGWDIISMYPGKIQTSKFGLSLPEMIDVFNILVKKDIDAPIMGLEEQGLKNATKEGRL